MTSTTMTTATADFPTQAALNEQTRVIYQQVCKNQAEDHQKAISALVEQHGKAMIENRTHYEALLKEQRNENLVTLKGLRKDHEEELKKLKKDHEEEFKNLKNDHEEELKSLNDDHKKELKQKDEECEHKDKKAKKDHEEELKNIKKDHEEELKNLKNDHKGELEQKDIESEMCKKVIETNKKNFNEWCNKSHKIKEMFMESGCDEPQVIATLANNNNFGRFMTGDIFQDRAILMMLMDCTENMFCKKCKDIKNTTRTRQEVIKDNIKNLKDWCNKNEKNVEMFMESGCDEPQVVATLANKNDYGASMTGDIVQDRAILIMFMDWTENMFCKKCKEVKTMMNGKRKRDKEAEEMVEEVD